MTLWVHPKARNSSIMAVLLLLLTSVYHFWLKGHIFDKWSTLSALSVSTGLSYLMLVFCSCLTSNGIVLLIKPVSPKVIIDLWIIDWYTEDRVWLHKLWHPWVACTLLCRPGWTPIQRDPPTSASWVLGLRMCTTTAWHIIIFCHHFKEKNMCTVAYYLLPDSATEHRIAKWLSALKENPTDNKKA